MARPRTEIATYEAVSIRLPQDVMNICRSLAAAEDRSLNAQLKRIIESWLADHATTAPKKRRDVVPA